MEIFAPLPHWLRACELVRVQVAVVEFVCVFGSGIACARAWLMRIMRITKNDDGQTTPSFDDQIQRANKARPPREEDNQEHDFQREVDIRIVHMSGMLQHALLYIFVIGTYPPPPPPLSLALSVAAPSFSPSCRVSGLEVSSRHHSTDSVSD